MKSKKLYKSLVKAIKKVENNRRKIGEPTPIAEEYNERTFSEPTPDFIKKSQNLIFGLLTLRDTVNITINDTSIRITCDFNEISSNKLYNKERWLHIEIIKDIGLVLGLGQKKVTYKMSKFYDEIISQVNSIFKQVNDDNFINIYEDIMRETGLARNSNLDDLLD